MPSLGEMGGLQLYPEDPSVGENYNATQPKLSVETVSRSKTGFTVGSAFTTCNILSHDKVVAGPGAYQYRCASRMGQARRMDRCHGPKYDVCCERAAAYSGWHILFADHLPLIHLSRPEQA